MEKDSSKKIIEKIKQEEIKPISETQLRWKNYAFWIAWAAVIVLGSMFFSLILLDLSDVSFDFWRKMPAGRPIFVLFRTAPFLWLALLALAMVIGYLAFRKTKKGYRYNNLIVIGLVVIFVGALGLVIHWSRANSGLEKGLLKKFPKHKNLIMMRESRMEMPEEGILGGLVVSVDSSKIILRSFRNNEWEVLVTKNTQIKRTGDIKKDIQIMVIGKKIDENTFEAIIIRVIKRPPEMMNPHRLPEGAGKPWRMEHRQQMRW